MAKWFGFNGKTTGGAIVFEKGSNAERYGACSSRDWDYETMDPDQGSIVGVSEWGSISDDDGRRICAALQYFSETPTEEIERLANERFPRPKDL